MVPNDVTPRSFLSPFYTLRKMIVLRDNSYTGQWQNCRLSVIITNPLWSLKALSEWCFLNTMHIKTYTVFVRQITSNVYSIFNCVNVTPFNLRGTLFYQNEYSNLGSKHISVLNLQVLRVTPSYWILITDLRIKST